MAHRITFMNHRSISQNLAGYILVEFQVRILFPEGREVMQVSSPFSFVRAL